LAKWGPKRTVSIEKRRVRTKDEVRERHQTCVVVTARNRHRTESLQKPRIKPSETARGGVGTGSDIGRAELGIAGALIEGRLALRRDCVEGMIGASRLGGIAGSGPCRGRAEVFAPSAAGMLGLQYCKLELSMGADSLHAFHSSRPAFFPMAMGTVSLRNWTTARLFHMLFFFHLAGLAET
jgi:hypothetical protein